MKFRIFEESVTTSITGENRNKFVQFANKLGKDLRIEQRYFYTGKDKERDSEECPCDDQKSRLVI